MLDVTSRNDMDILLEKKQVSFLEASAVTSHSISDEGSIAGEFEATYLTDTTTLNLTSSWYWQESYLCH